MKNSKIIFLLVLLFIVCQVSIGQVTQKITKPISEQDKMEIQSILKYFNASSYKISVKTENGVFAAGKARNLMTVKQHGTITGMGHGGVAATNTNINIFKEALAATNTNINLFKNSAAATNTNINLFKNAKFTEAQLGKLDQLHAILSKY